MTLEPHESVPLVGFPESSSPESLAECSREFLSTFRRRRTVRDFSDRPVAKDVIENCIQAAALSPSGANQQPWHFDAVNSQEIKHKIRLAVEAAEREFYNRRAPQDWLDTLAPLGTDANKPFLEVAPWLIAIFAQTHGGVDVSTGATKKHYYVNESVGIAVGVLIAALNQCGLATLTHTPSPMNFLREILNRPANEKAYLLLVVGYPAENCRVPKITKKPLNEICTVW